MLAAILALTHLLAVDIRPIWFGLAMLQGGVAAIIGRWQKAPPWWVLIHLGFLPLALAVHRLDVPSEWFLAGFLVLLLVFWRTDKSRVPLYLTNRPTAEALLELIPTTPCKMADIGCGEGGLLLRLAKARPDCHFVGIEHAPLTWLLARLRTARMRNVIIRRSDFWRESLAGYDVVYAFLSPAPMPKLWGKALAEMKSGALLVSNSFTVPKQQAEQVVRVHDRRGTLLHCFHPRPAQQGGEFAAFPAISHPVNQE